MTSIQQVKETNILTLRINVSPNENKAFVDWQGRFNSIISAFPGFVSLEIISQNKNNPDSWIFIQRFQDSNNASSWKISQEYVGLIQELRSFMPNVQVQIQESGTEELALQNGVTEVFITQVEPNKVSGYRKWITKIHQEEAKFPGFQGVYVQPPMPGYGQNWITFLHFDNAINLERWLNSSERKNILKESTPLIASIERHRVYSPFAGWFSSLTKYGSAPTLWKQTMTILLVLFPIVMLEFKYLNPFTKALNISLGTFIGNLISVMLISWPAMPIAIYFLRWWLSPSISSIKISMLGTLLVLFLYLIEIIIFWSFI